MIAVAAMVLPLVAPITRTVSPDLRAETVVFVVLVVVV
jgi:hypothetical protein